MSRILACIDDSPHVHGVCAYAAWAAHRMEAGIEILHVLDSHDYETITPDYSGNLGPGGVDAVVEAMVTQREAAARNALQRGLMSLEAAKAQLVDLVPWTDAHQRSGPVVDTIVARALSASLLVIGKQGENTAAKPNQLGHHLEAIVRAVHIPVLVTTPDVRPVAQVMIAFDGSPSMRKAIAFLTSSPLLTGTSLRLVSVGKDQARLRQEVEPAATTLGTAGYAVTIDVLSGDPDQVIPEWVATSGADLLVMGAFGHGRIRELILGSMTSRLLGALTVPLLVVH